MHIYIKPLKISAKVCRSILSKAMGFMFSFSRKNAKLFVFDREKNAGIHMLFVFFPLIIVWLDKNGKIVKIKKALPFLFYGEAKAKYILEIPYEKGIYKKLKRMKSLWRA